MSARGNTSLVAHTLAAACAVACLSPSPASAQRGVDVELFHPALDNQGIFTVDRAETPRAWDFGVRVFANVAGEPLTLTMSDASDPTHAAAARRLVVDRQVALDIGFHLGLTNWLELVTAFAVTAASYTDAYGSYGASSDPRLGRSGFYLADRYTNVAPPDAAPLDARLGFKARLVRAGLFGLAAAAVVTLPFGDDSAFLGDSSYTFRPTLIADVTRGPLTIAINGGVIVRRETRVYDPYDLAGGVAAPRLLIDVGHELTWSIGVAYRVARWAALAAEAYGLVPLVGSRPDYTADLVGGLQLFVSHDVAVSVGGGAGVITSASRRDLFRAFLGVSWSPSISGGGGRPGVDSDHDGIPDSEDRCPMEAEDRDGFDDEDGCPDLDNDQDGIADANDRCPNEPEDRDGFEDEDGCPEPDNDGDGIVDVQDKCPNAAEDRDGFEDEDGCPDDDNDGDGIADARDKCPNEPETRNGVDDDDGCPDSGGEVVVGAGRISLPDAIFFEPGSARLAARSFALVDRVADRLKANRGVKRVRIEGHTDDVGTARANLELSQARADAVREYLMRKGVEAERLSAVGFGNTRPIDRRRTAEARAKNRRVELVIVEQP